MRSKVEEYYLREIAAIGVRAKRRAWVLLGLSMCVLLTAFSYLLIEERLLAGAFGLNFLLCFREGLGWISFSLDNALLVEELS